MAQNTTYTKKALYYLDTPFVNVYSELNKQFSVYTILKNSWVWPSVTKLVVYSGG